MDLDPIKQSLNADTRQWNSSIKQATDVLSTFGMMNSTVERQMKGLERQTGDTAEALDKIEKLQRRMLVGDWARRSGQPGGQGRTLPYMQGAADASLFPFTSAASPAQAAAAIAMMAAARARSAAVGPTTTMGRLLWGTGAAQGFVGRGLFGQPTQQTYGSYQGGLLGGGSAMGFLSNTMGSLAGFAGSFLMSMLKWATIGAIISSVALGITAVYFSLKTLTHYAEEATSAVVRFGMSMEMMQVQFEVLAGGVDKGRQLFSDIQEMSLRTPFSAEQLADTTKLLLGMGTAVEDILPALSRLGDIAAGDHDRMMRLARAVEEVQAENKLTGLRLRQFASLGIGVHDFAETLGVADHKFMSMLRNGEVSGNVVIDTVNRLTEGVGRFAGMNERSLQTVRGQWNRFVNQLEILAGRLGMQIFQRYGIADLISRATSAIQENAPGVTENIIAFLDRARVSAEALFEVFQVGFKVVADMFGQSGAGAQMFATTLEGVRLATLNLAQGMIAFGASAIQTMASIARVIMTVGVNLPIDVIAKLQRVLEYPVWVGATLGTLGTAEGPQAREFLRQEFMRPSGIENLQNQVGTATEFLDTMLGGGAQGIGAFTEKWMKGIDELKKQGPGGVRGRVPLTPGAGKNFFGATTTGQLYELPWNLTQGQFSDMYQSGQIREAPENALTNPTAAGRWPGRPQISFKAQEAVDKLEKAMELGLTPYEKLLRQQELLEEALRGPTIGFTGEGVGRMPIRGEGIPFEQFAAGSYLNFQEQTKHLQPIEERLSKASFAGTAEAQDIINKSNFTAQQSAYDRFENAMERIRAQQEEFQKDFDDFVNWLKAGGFIKEG